MNKMSENVRTMQDLADYIVKYADVIAVRVKFEDQWQSKFLSELPAVDALREGMRFIKEGRVPIRLRRPDEIDGNQE